MLVSIAVCITAVLVTFVSTFAVTNKDEIEKKLLLYASLVKNDVEERLYGANDVRIAGHIFYMLSNISDNDSIDTVYYGFGDETTVCLTLQEGELVFEDAADPPCRVTLYENGYATGIDEQAGGYVSAAVGLFSPEGELFGAIQMTYRSDSFTELYTLIIERVAAAYTLFALLVILIVSLPKKRNPREGGEKQ